MKTTHRQRAEAVRGFLSHNKLFLAIAALVILLLLSGNNVLHDRKEQSRTDEQSQTQEAEEQTTEDLSWRFYPIDGVIMLVGGGFCVVQIIREKRKAKEELK